MKPKRHYLLASQREGIENEMYKLYVIDRLDIPEIAKKTGYGRTTVYEYICNFEKRNPDIKEQMKKRDFNITEKDYEDLKKEILKLKKQLAKESLRADFYEEMVKFGEEVYGIDLKKAGTK